MCLKNCFFGAEKNKSKVEVFCVKHSTINLKNKNEN